MPGQHQESLSIKSNSLPTHVRLSLEVWVELICSCVILVQIVALCGSFLMRPGGRPGVTCTRCRQVQASEGDTWCSSCTSWEALGRELAGHWDSEGCRRIATDIILNSVRQVKALRALGAGFHRGQPAALVVGDSRAGGSRAPDSRPEGDPRGSLPRKRPAPPPLKPKEESSEERGADSEELEEESEEEELPLDPGHKPIRSSGQDRPPEPQGPPPQHRHQQQKDGAGETRAQSSRGSRRHRDRRTEGGRRRVRKHRAGRKHQRLYRLLNDPFLPVHRKPSEAYWELSSLGQGVAALDRSIL